MDIYIDVDMDVLNWTDFAVVFVVDDFLLL